MADSSFPFSLGCWDLAPGEAISQSPPRRPVKDAQDLVCPPPTLDTQEFLANHPFSEDCSSMDSLGEYSLAPGEDRSQSPFPSAAEPKLPQCPPQTLDTQEFLNNEEVWVVEDSLGCWDVAPSQCGARCPPSEPREAPNQLSPLPVDNQESEQNRVISDDVWMVEDSLECWQSTPSEDGPECAADKLNALKPPSSVKHLGRSTDQRQSNPTAVNTVVKAGIASKVGSDVVVPGKRRLSPTRIDEDSVKPEKRLKLDSGADPSTKPGSLPLPAPSTGRFPLKEGHGRVSALGTFGRWRGGPLKAEKVENVDAASLPASKEELPAIGFRRPSHVQPAANNAENFVPKASPARDFALMDITNRKLPERRSPKKPSISKGAIESTVCKNSVFEGTSSLTRELLTEKRDVGLPPVNRVVVTDPVQHSAKKKIASSIHELGRSMKDTQGNARSLDLKSPGGAQVKAKVQTALNVQPSTTRRLQPQEPERDNDGWLCPRNSKKPATKQLLLDRWIN